MNFFSRVFDRAIDDNDGVLAAINKSQALIEFSPDGVILAANENFLQVMGYSLSDLVGKRHSVFMPAETLDSSGYREFWNHLANGIFQAG